MEYGEKYLKYKDKIVFGKQSMPSFDRLPKEYFENEACFIFINTGAVSVRTQNTVFGIDKNHGVLAKCLNYFFETNREQRKSGNDIEVVGIILYPSLVEELFEFDLSLYSYRISENAKQVEIDRLLANYRDSISILIDNPEIADEQIIRNKLKEFILLMAKSQNAPSELDFLAALFNPTSFQFKSVISNNIYSNLSIDEYARLCHLSLSSFKRKFKEIYHDTPLNYMTNKKVNRAAELLKSGNLRVSEIAYEVGFDSVATFNRNFRKFYNSSPSEYRMGYFEKSLD